MARFLAGLACGAMIVGASWYGNRLGYEHGRADAAAAHEQSRADVAAARDQARADVALAQRFAAQLHERDREASRDQRDDSGCAEQPDPEGGRGGSAYVFASTRARKEPPCKDRPYRFGSQRKFHCDDPGGPWVNLPAPEISPAERAKLVAELEARGALVPK